jgi:hypothetical protein
LVALPAIGVKGKEFYRKMDETDAHCEAISSTRADSKKAIRTEPGTKQERLLNALFGEGILPIYIR